jgi:hypothetical protein
MSLVNPPNRRVFTSDGSRLFVGDITTGKTNTQVFAESYVNIDGEDAYTSFSQGKLFVQLGDQTYWWKGEHVAYPVWCLRTKSVYFLVPETKDKRTVSIWKWSKPTGFFQVSKKPIRGLYYLRTSLDQRSLTAMIYDERKASVFTCDLDGGNQKFEKASYYNFDPVMIDADHFILNEQHSSYRGTDTETREIDVVEWFKKSDNRKPFKIDGRDVDGAIAFDGFIWVLFQKPTFRFLPWMISRGDDDVTVAKLNRERTKILREIRLTGTQEELWRD